MAVWNRARIAESGDVDPTGPAGPVGGGRVGFWPGGRIEHGVGDSARLGSLAGLTGPIR